MLEYIKKIWKNEIYQKNILIIGCLPFAINLLIEMFNRQSFFGGFAYIFQHPIPYLCNSLVIMASLGVMLLLKRRMFYITLITFIWILLGFVNLVLLSLRVTPFNASDLKLSDAGVGILNQYFDDVTIVLIGIAAVLILGFIIFLFIRGRKIDYKIRYGRNIFVVAGIFALCTLVMWASIQSGVMALKFTNLTNAYHEYGFVYCFGNGLVNTGVKKPKDYSQNKIDLIVEKIEKGKGAQETEEPKMEDMPNVIFLQLESFFDINKVKNLELSQDPIPYFNQMKKEFSSGYLDVFNVGYGTCNTEFEVMTGMNLDDFGPGEIPYKTILQTNTCETTAYVLKEYGYATHAFHNNDATFYSRNEVFKNMGFDTFTALEYMHITEFTPRNWAKDKFLTDEIISALQSTENQKDYIYTISVQGHGGYPTTPSEEAHEIRVLNMEEDEGRKNSIEYYVNQIHEMDGFLRELTDKLSKLGEDVVLVMYGDHLPGLGFVESDLENGSLYQTEYIIWNNMDLEVVHEDVQAYQLSAKVMNRLGVNAGIINPYHQYCNGDEDYLGNLKNLEYDIFYGNCIAYGGINPYTPTKAKLGIDDIKIKCVELEVPQSAPAEEQPETPEHGQTDDKQYVLVRGEHFTEFSIVYRNGERCETEYIDEQTLRVPVQRLESLDAFVVSQVDLDDGTVLSSTKECLYYGK